MFLAIWLFINCVKIVIRAIDSQLIVFNKLLNYCVKSIETK